MNNRHAPDVPVSLVVPSRENTENKNSGEDHVSMNQMSKGEHKTAEQNDKQLTMFISIQSGIESGLNKALGNYLL